MIDRKEAVRKKLISNSRAIIANPKGLPVGILTMSKLTSIYLSEIKELGLDLIVFNDAFDEIKDFSLGSERLHFNADLLVKQDKKLDQKLKNYRESILIKCFEIIKVLNRSDS